MAQGDVVFFDQALLSMAKGQHDFESGTFFMGITDGTTTPTSTTADPRWGSGGTTDFKAEEVTPGGNYAADGKSLANPSATLNAGLVDIDMDDPAVWSSNASNPTDATWGIIYNNQAAKGAVAFVDIGGVFDMTTGDLKTTFGSPLITLNQAP